MKTPAFLAHLRGLAALREAPSIGGCRPQCVFNAVVCLVWGIEETHEDTEGRAQAQQQLQTRVWDDVRAAALA